MRKLCCLRNTDLCSNVMNVNMISALGMRNPSKYKTRSDWLCVQRLSEIQLSLEMKTTSTRFHQKMLGAIKFID